MIVTGDEAGTIKIWIPSSASSAQTTEKQSTADGPTPEFVVAQSVEAHGASVSALGQCSISDTEALILSGGSDAVVHVWRWSHTVSDAGGTSESPTLIRHDCESLADLTLSLLHVELVKVQTLDLGGRLPLDMALHKLPDSDGMSLSSLTIRATI